MDPGRHSEGEPERGRADISEMEEAPYSVLGGVDDLEMARRLIEDLEEHGVPANAIELIGAETRVSPGPDTDEAVAESRVFGAISRSMLVGGLVGLTVGALLGLLVALLTQGFAWPWGLLMGGVFGGAAGGVAGGMSVVKYSSPAWDETHEIEETIVLRVGVHHADRDVIDSAAKVIGRHVRGEVTRLGGS